MSTTLIDVSGVLPTSCGALFDTSSVKFLGELVVAISRASRSQDGSVRGRLREGDVKRFQYGRGSGPTYPDVRANIELKSHPVLLRRPGMSSRSSRALSPTLRE